MALRLISLYFAVVCAAQAEVLPDPTRPAVGWNATTSVSASPIPSGPQLQAIRIQGLQRSALISGESVTIGSKIEGATITRIDEDRVWLRGPQGVQQLKLFPEVEKQNIDTPAVHRGAQIKARAIPPTRPHVHPNMRKELRKESE